MLDSFYSRILLSLLNPSILVFAGYYISLVFSEKRKWPVKEVLLIDLKVENLAGAELLYLIPDI